MNSFVYTETRARAKCFPAMSTDVRFFPGVIPYVSRQMLLANEPFRAQIARKRFLSGMNSSDMIL